MASVKKASVSSEYGKYEYNRQTLSFKENDSSQMRVFEYLNSLKGKKTAFVTKLVCEYLEKNKNEATTTQETSPTEKGEEKIKAEKPKEALPKTEDALPVLSDEEVKLLEELLAKRNKSEAIKEKGDVQIERPAEDEKVNIDDVTMNNFKMFM